MENGARCQACQRMHSASFIVTLSGNSYDSDALWIGKLSPLEFLAIEETKEGFSDESSNVTVIVPQSSAVTFQIGSHCHKRAQLYHRLAHFKASLILQISVCYFPHLIIFHCYHTIFCVEQKRIAFVKKRLPDDSDFALIVNTILDDNDWCSHVCCNPH